MNKRNYVDNVKSHLPLIHQQVESRFQGQLLADQSATPDPL